MKLIRTKLNDVTCYSEFGSKSRADKIEQAKAQTKIMAEYGAVYVEPKEDEAYPTLITCPELLLTAEQYADLIIRGVNLESPIYLKTKGNDDSDPFVAVMAKIDELLAMDLSSTGDTHYNSKCEVAMPGQALAMYNDTQLLTDGCTDALQNELTAGWRIIAACPQPNQRRPDYILGRFNPEIS